MLTRSSCRSVKMSNKRNRNNFIKVNGFIKKRKELIFVVAEFIAGFWYNSLGLISDAGHNLGDVFSLVLAMLAFRLAKVSPTLRYTYGYKKSTILVSLLNAVILLVAVGFILGESIDCLLYTSPSPRD